MLSKLGSLSIRMVGLAGPGYTERDRGYHILGSLGQGASSESVHRALHTLFKARPDTGKRRLALAKLTDKTGTGLHMNIVGSVRTFLTRTGPAKLS